VFHYGDAVSLTRIGTGNLPFDLAYVPSSDPPSCPASTPDNFGSPRCRYCSLRAPAPEMMFIPFFQRGRGSAFYRWFVCRGEEEPRPCFFFDALHVSRCTPILAQVSLNAFDGDFCSKFLPTCGGG